MSEEDWVVMKAYMTDTEDRIMRSLGIPSELLMNKPEEVQAPTKELYERDKKFAKVIDMLAAYRSYQGGQPIKEIAQQAGRSESTIRKWLKEMEGTGL